MSNYRIKPPLLIIAVLLFLASYAMQSSAEKPPPSAPVSNTIAVQIKDFRFVPDVITIAPGQVVVWINSDDEPHSVVAADKSFRSTSLDTGERFARTFAGSGEFRYYCSFHPHMMGKIIVAQPAQGS